MKDVLLLIIEMITLCPALNILHIKTVTGIFIVSFMIVYCAECSVFLDGLVRVCVYV